MLQRIQPSWPELEQVEQALLQGEQVAIVLQIEFVQVSLKLQYNPAKQLQVCATES